MIKCNRCGNVNTAGAVRCLSCGNALSSIDASGGSAKVVSQDQSALPAWLESLRVGERTSRPASKPPQFSPADLMEDSSLPSWMHAQRNETQDVTGANLPASLRSSALTAPNTDNAPFPATSFAAQSLIDEQSLPSWMQEEQAPTSLPTKDGMAAGSRGWMQEGLPSTPFPPAGGISGGDLVDKENVPDWMRSLQQQSGVPGRGQPKQVANTDSPIPLSPSLASGFAARDLVDQQSLPSWLTQLGKQDSTASASRDQSIQSPPANEQSQPMQPGQKGFAARDLIDQQSLPSWMVQQSGQNALAPTNSEQAKRSSQSGIGLPASSLLDMNALPSWLVQNGQAQTTSPAYSQPPNPAVPSNQPWLPQQPTAQGTPADSSAGAGGRLAASSIIDMNALPEWLRSSGSQQPVQEASSQPYSAPYAGPPRVENVRVPSRPRGDISSSETSEMAASVFASMLGVASTAPSFPPTSGVPYQQPVQPGRVEQMTLSGVSGIAAMPGQGGMSMAGIGNQGGTNMGGMPGGQGAQSMSGIPGGSGVYSMPGGQGAQSMPGIPGGSGVYSMPGGQGTPSMPGIPGGSGVYSMPGGQGAQSMPGIPGGSGIYSMPGGQGAQSMPGIPGGSGVYSMPGGQGVQSMPGIPGGSGVYSMPGGQGAQSMPGIPGGSGVYSMPGGQGAQSMPGIPGGQDIQSMSGIPGSQDVQSMGSMLGGVGGQNMGGNAYRNPTGAPSGPNAAGAAREEKNVKKRGLFGALLDWLSR